MDDAIFFTPTIITRTTSIKKRAMHFLRALPATCLLSIYNYIPNDKGVIEV